MDPVYIIDDDSNTIDNSVDNSISKFRKLQDEIYELFQKKNKDYGDAFKENGSIGTLIRIKEKVGRLKNFIKIDSRGITYKERKPNVVDESLRDTLMDLNSYSLMMLMLLEEEKEEEKEEKER